MVEIGNFTIYRNFFSIIRRAIWDEEKVCLDRPDWDLLFQIAKEQCVAGLFFEGLCRLPEEQGPHDSGFVMKVASIAQRIKNTNLSVNRGVKEIYCKYRELGCEPIIMKGQSVATRYKTPDLRQCGDIDLYIPNEEQLKKINGWVASVDKNYDDFYNKHRSFHWHKNIIENHYQLVSFAFKKYEENLNAIVNSELEECKQLPKRDIGECVVTELPVTLYAMFLLIHMSYHVLEDGLGLRQVVDWTMFINEHHDEIDKGKFDKWLNELDLTILANAFATICVDYLGLDENLLPFKLVRNAKLDGLLLDEIFNGGNFGRKHYVYKGKVSKLEDMWRTLWIKLPRYAHFYKFWPKEALASYRYMASRGYRRIFGILK